MGAGRTVVRKRFQHQTLERPSAGRRALGCAPVFFLWNRWWADLIMASYAVLANLPCILVQRYNRLRFQRVLTKQSGPAFS